MMPPPPLEYSRFLELWDEGAYFECHEELEILWRREENPGRKLFFQGLIHCAVALVHVERGNEIGARNQWVKAKRKLASCALEYSRPEYSRCDVREILELVEQKIKEQFGLSSEALWG